jgi:acetyl-CoA carboxylase beta subunit
MHNQLKLTYGKVDKQKDKFIRDNLWIKRTDEEELVYRKELERYTSRLTSIKDEI